MPDQPMGPDRYGAEELLAHLGVVQHRARQIMRDFNITSGHITIMARQAELMIADTGVRAEFLRLLIDLHEFGREARSRGILGNTKPTGDAPGRAPKSERAGETKLFASSDGALDDVSEEASRALFTFLDR